MAAAVGFAGLWGQRTAKVLRLEAQSLVIWLVGRLEMKDEIPLWAERAESGG